MNKTCVICGKEFEAPPSSKKITCSRECSHVRKHMSHLGKSNVWSDESRAKKREEGRSKNLQLGTPAAKRSPKSGRFDTNQEAKIWYLIDPTGTVIVVRNLDNWARNNTHRFGKPPGDKSSRQISSGFRQIALSLNGKRAAPVFTYFGWRLYNAPQIPDD